MAVQRDGVVDVMSLLLHLFKRIPAWPCVMAVLLLLSSAGSHATIRVQDDRGAWVTLPSTPQRIISLLPSLTETVCELGACSRLVGVDRYSNYPAAVRKLPNVGGQEDTNIEMVLALRPDLVLVSKSSRVMERLEALGLKVIALAPEGYTDVRRVANTVAMVLGQQQAGERLWARMEAQVNAAVREVPASMRGKSVYFEVDSAPYAAGEASYIGYLINRMGLRNVVPPALGPFPKLNPEFVVRANPQVIMVSDRQRTAVPVRPGWAVIQAVKTNSVCTFTSDAVDVITRPGPRFGEAALTMSACLRKVAARGDKR